MDIKINQKIIKDMCGSVSFKKGEAFYRDNKVIFENFNDHVCEARVKGLEDFYVTVEKDERGDFRTKCTCPRLTSFQKECQHVAAVLLAINHHKQHGNVLTEHVKLTEPSEKPIEHPNEQALTNSLLTIFKEKPKRTSGHQLHFETRKVLDTEFICQLTVRDSAHHLVGLELKIGATKVQNIRAFLTDIKEGKPSQLSNTFKYDPTLHCFAKETDAVIQKLLLMVEDEKSSTEILLTQTDYEDMVFILPSSWKELVSTLGKAPFVKIVVGGQTFKGFHITEETLPLQFDFIEAAEKGFRLNIKGLNLMIVLDAYDSVFYDGRFFQLKSDDCNRLSELKGMVEKTGTNQIPIPEDQLALFLEKVVPGLRKLGIVNLSDKMTNRLIKTPLVAKLYLDRVKNRLLAGLEFHYENIMINPLEGRERRIGASLIRDVEKEKKIMELLEDSQFTRTDGGYYLHNEELEYEFLYYVVPKLQKLAHIYATTAVRNRILREGARPRIRVKMQKERTNWLEFKFEMDGIPEKQIKDVLAALEEKRKYYRLKSGSLLSLESREFAEIQRFLHALPVQDEDIEARLNVPIVEGFRLLNSISDSNAFTIEESFQKFLESIRNPSSIDIDVPESLDSVLRNYQKQGYKWMKTLARYGFGGILGDTMGLGKTLQSITYIRSELPVIQKNRQPVLVVCPSSLTYNWLYELQKFTPEIEALVIDGNKVERLRKQKDMGDVDVVITSYPIVRRDIKSFEKQVFHTVFFDEAQFFKNPATKTAHAVKKIHAEHRFALTGTPVENSIEELWSIFHVVFPELFKGLREYSHLTKKEISRRIRPFMLRRLKEDVLSELPEKIESVETVELLPDQKKLYAAYLAKLRQETLKHLDKDTLRKNRIRILAGITRLRQICCHPALFVDGYKGSSAKFEALMQIVEEAKLSGRRVLIFSQFTKMLQMIGRELSKEGMPFFYLDGQTPSEERVGICQRFNEGERDFFLISLKAGGTGLNLTGADTVILYDIWWNPAVEEQAMDRAHRIGQTNTVQVIKLVARGSIEEKMNELQDRKRQLIGEIIDPEDKNSASTLTDQDIRDILMI